ncbi:hypothetical protein [uncultured Shewanella sp.]|uniref:hypothetical protein n=1 Tax=uncultured Shewanella sp. TaxID=173975 RepID=UPI0026091648|nr:hypothetical protein [uncultured Shewanella sp.]
MKALLKSVAFLGLASASQGALAETVDVNALHDWQTVEFASPVNSITSITGGWSVDTYHYSSVGASGHTGQAARSLAPWNHYKYDRKYPFGALLVDIEGMGHMDVKGPMMFEEPVTSIRIRINDIALGDNKGILTVTFE